jgi:hypothetical protein
MQANWPLRAGEACQIVLLSPRAAFQSSNLFGVSVYPFLLFDLHDGHSNRLLECLKLRSWAATLITLPPAFREAIYFGNVFRTKPLVRFLVRGRDV